MNHKNGKYFDFAEKYNKHNLESKKMSQSYTLLVWGRHLIATVATELELQVSI